MTPNSLRELIHYAWEKSPFYQTFWQKNNFNPERDFRNDDDIQKIPILTKTDLLSVSLKDRSIINSENWHYFPAISSGTTNKPLIFLHSEFMIPAHYLFIKNKVETISSILILRPPGYASSFFMGITFPAKYFDRGSIISLGDMNDLRFSTNIAKELGTDCLIVRPSDAIKIGEIFEEHGYHPSHIKLLWLTGEPLTLTSISLLNYIYRDAIVLFSYAMTECPGPIGTRSSLCTTLNSISPCSYHLNTEKNFFEEMDGSLIITSLHKLPTPIIRYNTGDKIIIKKDFQCSCGFPADTIGIIGSRANENSYKIGGFTFQAESIRKALQKLSNLITDDFLLQIEQIRDGNRLKCVFDITVRPIDEKKPFFTDIIRKTLETEIYVTRSKSLGNAIHDKSIKPISISYDANLQGEHILPPHEILKPFEKH